MRRGREPIVIDLGVDDEQQQPPMQRQRRVPGVIDLTGDDFEVPLRRPRAPNGVGVIDLTGDQENNDGDEDDVIIVGGGGQRLREQLQDLQRVREQLRVLSEARQVVPIPRTVPMPHVPPPLAPRLVAPRAAIRGRGKARKVKAAKVARQAVEGNACPVCFEDFVNKKKVQYCIYGCGGNIHAACLAQWKKSRARVPNAGPLACVLCRCPWNGMKTVQD